MSEPGEEPARAQRDSRPFMVAFLLIIGVTATVLVLLVAFRNKKLIEKISAASASASTSASAPALPASATAPR